MCETIYEDFKLAGFPYDVTNMGGFSIFTVIAAGLLNRIFQGQLAGPSEGAVRSSFVALGAERCGFHSSHWECLEAAWEPAFSPRVQWVRRQRMKAGPPIAPVSVVMPLHTRC